MAKVYKDYSKQVLAGINNKIDIAIQEACISVTTESKARTPVDTGNLQGNNDYKTSTGKGNLAIGQPTGHSGVVGNLTDYAIWRHFGTSRIKAEPWLWNALVAKAGFILNIFKRRLG